MNSKEMLRFVQQLTELIEERDRYREALRTLQAEVFDYPNGRTLTSDVQFRVDVYVAMGVIEEALTPRLPTEAGEEKTNDQKE